MGGDEADLNAGDVLARMFDPLRTHLALSDDAGLWVVIVPSHAAEETVAEWIQRTLGASHRVTAFRFTSSARSLARALRAHGATEGEVFLVQGLGLLGDDARRDAIALLNRGREALSEAPRTVVLFIERSLLAQVLHGAGDFWSWRRGVTDLCELPLTMWPTSDDDRARLRAAYLRALAEETATMELPLPLRYLRPRRGQQHTHVKTTELAWRWRELVVDEGIAGRVVPLAEMLSGLEPVLLLGEWGLGASTWLRSLAHDLSREGGESYPSLGLPVTALPVLFSALAVEEHRVPDADVELALQRFYVARGQALFGGLVIDAIKRGDALLLVDHVEGIPDRTRREVFLGALRRMCARRPGVRCITKAYARSISGEGCLWRRASLPEPGWREVDSTVRVAREIAGIHAPRLNPFFGAEPASDALRLGLANDPAFVAHAAVVPGLFSASRADSARAPVVLGRARHGEAGSPDSQAFVAKVALATASQDGDDIVTDAGIPPVDPRRLADSDVLVALAGGVAFRSRTFFLRALVDALPAELIEQCDEALFAPVARSSLELFGTRVGLADPPYERVLRRRARLADTVLSNTGIRHIDDIGELMMGRRGRTVRMCALSPRSVPHLPVISEPPTRAFPYSESDRRLLARGAAAVPASAAGWASWLLHLIDDPLPDIRAICVEACTRQALLQPVDLMERVRTATTEERVAYARGLVTREQPPLAETWRWLLADTEAAVRATAAELLTVHPDRALAAFVVPLILDPVEAVWMRAARVVRFAFGEHLDALAETIDVSVQGHPQPSVARMIGRARAALETGELDETRALLHHEADDVRRMSAETLVHAGVPPRGEILARMQRDPVAAVRAAACDWIAMCPPATNDHHELLVRAVSDEATTVRTSAALALVRGTAFDVAWQHDAIFRLLIDVNADVACAAATALAEVPRWHPNTSVLLRHIADVLETTLLDPSWAPHAESARDVLATRALAVLAEALSVIRFSRFAASW